MTRWKEISPIFLPRNRAPLPREFVSCRYFPVPRNEEMNSQAFSHNVSGDSCRNFPTAHVPFPASVSTSADARNGSSWNYATPASANLNRLLDRQEAATYLRLKPQTLANWVVTRAHNLPHVKIGRRVMYRLADLDAFVMANRHGNEAVIGGASV